MASETSKGQDFDVRLNPDGVSFTVTVPEHPAITLHEDAGHCAELRAGALPNALRLVIEDYLKQHPALVQKLRDETAGQMWSEYAEGPNGGWRAAGDTNAQSPQELSQILGEGTLGIYVEADGTPTMAEIWWSNTRPFLGHSVFTQVYNLDDWSEADASLFG